MQREHLYAVNKLDYARGERPKVDCILCSVIEKDPQVDNLEVHRTEHFVVSVNLYPYNPGHLMIVPHRHIEWPHELTDTEVLAMHHLQNHVIKVTQSVYPASGFNLGYNLGPNGGGSIKHLHLHLVPRFKNEQGFMATVCGTQIMVEDPHVMVDKFRAAFATFKS